MWKPLSIASGAVLLAAGGITYTQVRPDLIGERIEVTNATENLVKAQTNLTNAEKAKTDAGHDVSTNSYQSYSETFPVRGKLDAANMSRVYDNGVLTFRIPKS